MSKPQTFDEYKKLQAEIDEVPEVDRVVLQLKLGVASFESFVRAVEIDSDVIDVAHTSIENIQDADHAATMLTYRMLNEWEKGRAAATLQKFRADHEEAVYRRYSLLQPERLEDVPDGWVLHEFGSNPMGYSDIYAPPDAFD